MATSRSIESIGLCDSIMSSAEDEEEYTFVHEKDKEVNFKEQVTVTKDTKVDDKDGEKAESSSSDADEENEEKEMPKLESTDSEAWPWQG